MSRFPYLLFDADNTLFCFDAANRYSFQTVCRAAGIPFSDKLLACYERHNNAAWEKMERGEATKEQIVIERFVNFLREIGADADPAACNKLHLETLAQCVFMMPHAVDVVKKLSESHTLYLVTNAVAAVQRSRLSKSPILPYIKDAFISEVAGAAKPTCAYFDYVFSQVPELTRENCLVIGDSLSSDIQGANNYGLPCCWFNHKHQKNTRGLRIDYEIDDLRQLFEIV